MKSYNEESDEEYFLEVDVQYLDFPFLLEAMKTQKVQKL